ncbi:MAG: PstS family phosphate ABC transporter substrate-binding protein [Candidatus Methanospirareceae archaeon]
MKPSSGRAKLLPVVQSVVLIVAIVGALLLSGCIDSTDESMTPGDYKGTITVSGAWALYPMMVKWAEEYQAIHPQVRIDISAGGAGKGMSDALGGMVDIGMVSRNIYPEEIERGALWVAVTKDAVVPTIHAQNPVLQDLLSKGVQKQTLLDLWITGTTTTWGAVAGTDAAEEINVYTRSDACGAAETWAAFLGGHNQEDLLGVAVYGDPGLAQAVQDDTRGIGYNNLNFAYDPHTGVAVAGITVLPLDLNGNGVLDADEDFYETKEELMAAIASGAYPSPPSRDLNLVTKGKPTGLTRDFILWCLTDGQQYVTETGYIPLSEEKIAAERIKIA